MASNSSNDDIIVTFTFVDTGETESVTVSASETTLKSAYEWACALFGLSDEIQLVHNGRVFESSSGLSLGAANVKNGDLIAVLKQKRVQQQQQQQQQQQRQPVLDFSNLLASHGEAAPSSSITNNISNINTNTGGLTFDLTALSSENVSSQSAQKNEIVEWSGMTIEDAMERNPNPSQIVRLLLKNETLMKQLNYHTPILANKLKSAKDNVDKAIRLWRAEMFKGSLGTFTRSTEKNRKRMEMEERLRQNPMDAEANAFFGEEIRKRNVEQQYYQMMEDYPESMGRVLMLYIDANVNGHAIQAFVDSGAQSTIMSSTCAERCGLLHLLDTRFAGTAVGVGTGKILGRVHIAQLQIGSRYFPCSITIMDSEKGLGDKNMDFLFGLDMLKRHRGKIDLECNALVFTISKDNGDVEYMEAPFLHEKDLEETKGGTKGFNAEESNDKFTKRMLEAAEEENNSMEVDNDKKKQDKET